MALKTVGSLWLAKPGSKAKLSGYMDGPNRTKGPKVFVFPNDKATAENRQPQYRLVIQADEGEAEPAAFDYDKGNQSTDPDDDVPF